VSLDEQGVNDMLQKVDLLHKSRLIVEQEETREIESSQNQYKNPGGDL